MPIQWRYYVRDDQVERRFHLRRALAAVGPYLPSAMNELEKISLDASAVETDMHGVVQIITAQLDGKPYDIYSAPPARSANDSSPLWKMFLANGPRAPSWIYQTRMNDLTDAYGFAGFKTSNLLATMADEIDAYGEAFWYEGFAAKHDVSFIAEILETGGGAYLLLDLPRDQADAEDPVCLVVYMKERTPPEAVSFFHYLNMFMELGLTGA